MTAVASWLLVAALRGTIVLAVIYLATRLARRRLSPAAEHLLWLAGLVSFFVPDGYTLEVQRQIVVTPAAFLPTALDHAPRAIAGPGWLGVIAVAWLAVAVAMFAAAVVPYARLAGVVATLPTLAADDPRLQHARALARALGVRRFEVRLGAGIESFSLGLWRPIVVIPATMAPREARAVLAHELAHLARRDLWSGWLQTVTRAIFFMSPMVHIASRRMGVLRELSCDSAAVAAGATSSTGLAALLLAQASVNQPDDVAEPTAQAAGPVAMALGLPATLAVRVQRLLDSTPTPARTGRAAWLVAAALLGVSSMRVVARDQYVAASDCVYTPAFAQSLLASYPEADADSDGVLSKLEACDWQAGWRKDGRGPIEPGTRLAAVLSPEALCCNCGSAGPSAEPRPGDAGAASMGAEAGAGDHLVPSPEMLFVGRPTC